MLSRPVEAVPKKTVAVKTSHLSQLTVGSLVTDEMIYIFGGGTGSYVKIRYCGNHQTIKRNFSAFVSLITKRLFFPTLGSCLLSNEHSHASVGASVHCFNYRKMPTE
jgi:hypothetical protein